MTDEPVDTDAIRELRSLLDAATQGGDWEWNGIGMVWPKDGAPEICTTQTIVRTVTFHAPVVDRERHSDALTLWISEYQPAWLPEKEPF